MGSEPFISRPTPECGRGFRAGDEVSGVQAEDQGWGIGGVEGRGWGGG